MKTIPIEGELRERLGKGGARSLRRDGRIPAVLYGQGKSFHLTVDRKQFVHAMQEAHGENVIFDVPSACSAPVVRSKNAASSSALPAAVSLNTQ